MQVWALAVGKQTEMLATGGRDAVVNLWHDCTAADKEEAFRKEVSLFAFLTILKIYEILVLFFISMVHSGDASCIFNELN